MKIKFKNLSRPRRPIRKKVFDRIWKSSKKMSNLNCNVCVNKNAFRHKTKNMSKNTTELSHVFAILVIKHIFKFIILKSIRNLTICLIQFEEFLAWCQYQVLHQVPSNGEWDIQMCSSTILWVVDLFPHLWRS